MLLGGPWELLGSSWELLGSAWVLLGPGHEKEAKGASGKTSKFVTYKGSNAFSENAITAFTDCNLGFGRGPGEAICHRSKHSFLRLERAQKATAGETPQGGGHEGSQGPYPFICIYTVERRKSSPSLPPDLMTL